MRETTAIVYAKASGWKKAFVWAVAILGLIVVGLVVALLWRKKPKDVVDSTVEIAKETIAAMDAKAKAKAAAAAGMEQQQIDHVKEVAMIKNEYERTKALAKIALEDY